MKLFVALMIIPLATLLVSCLQETPIPVAVSFIYTLDENNHTVPAAVTLHNATTGAHSYHWTFEGGEPTTSHEKQPGTITYAQPGTYTLKLEAWNDFQSDTQEITLTLDSAVQLHFDIDIQVNNFIPATVALTNKTTGATSYTWTFEGGDPTIFEGATPPLIYYDTPGDHDITLEVSNGREQFTTTQTITLLPGLEPAFTIIPFFEDQDYEAPLTATLKNETTSGLYYTWSSDGGIINDNTSAQSEIYFDTPGTYTITLNANNDKETKSTQQTITVAPNSNLYTINDVKLGISTAHNIIGCFYATNLRSVIKENEVTQDNGPEIDLVFYAINSTFAYCKFVAPDQASALTFPAIPEAAHTYFVNTQEDNVLSLSETAFDTMTDDSQLSGMDIQGNATDTYFTDSLVPRIVLFQTQDGRKGALKIKDFVSDGSQSHILFDIKIQKAAP